MVGINLLVRFLFKAKPHAMVICYIFSCTVLAFHCVNAKSNDEIVSSESVYTCARDKENIVYTASS